MSHLCWTSGSCYKQIKRYLNFILISGLIMFLLKSIDGNRGYQCLPLVIKSRLVSAKIKNDKSERSLSINARVVASERSALGEVTITDLCSVMVAVKFYDLVNGQPGNIAITKELKIRRYDRLILHIWHD